MKIVGIFDKREEQVGFRLAGIETNIIKSKEELTNKLNSINNSKDIGILVINNNIFNLMPDEFKKIEKRQLPLLLKID